jgi:hypothetical protein
VVGFTTGSRGEVPGKRKSVIRDDDDDNNNNNNNNNNNINHGSYVTPWYKIFSEQTLDTG